MCFLRKLFPDPSRPVMQSQPVKGLLWIRGKKLQQHTAVHHAPVIPLLIILIAAPPVVPDPADIAKLRGSRCTALHLLANSDMERIASIRCARSQRVPSVSGKPSYIFQKRSVTRSCSICSVYISSASVIKYAASSVTQNAYTGQLQALCAQRSRSSRCFLLRSSASSNVLPFIT